jgi:lipopolysaccharide export system permease protein
MDRVFELLDLIIGKGLPLGVVLEVFALSLPFIMAVTIPMSVLVATLMSFGRLSQDNEISALRASGVSLVRCVFPVLLAGIPLVAFLIYFNNSILPESNHLVKNLLIDIAQKRPTLQIREGVFVRDFEGYSIFVRRMDERTSRIYNTTIYEALPNRSPRTIVAREGEIHVSADERTVQIRLRDGEIHELDETDPDRYLRLTFKTHTIVLPFNSELVRQQREYRSDREMSNRMMWGEIERLRPEIEHLRRLSSRTPVEAQVLGFRLREMNRYLVEIYKKQAISFACLIFVILGAPLGVLVRRGGIGTGFVGSLGFFVLYYVLLVGGEELADRGIVPPLLAMWAANVVLGVAGLVLLWSVSGRGRWQPRRARLEAAA